MSNKDVPLDLEHQLPPLQASPQDLQRMLAVIEDDIVSLTEEGVKDGNKVFGAAILDPSLKPVVVQTNSELKSPLFHGEVHCIYEWSNTIPPANRGEAAKTGVFLSTHEPCCMCISSIVWTGFQKVYYLFPYTLTASQGIPHDLNIMHELWGVSTYRKQNKFCTTACLMTLVQDLPDDEPLKATLQATIEKLMTKYEEMSNQYHTEKSTNECNSLAFG
mmetsp:Transcript_7963/g.14483  ORF Transcript_7963/g.14483 Transcript_7963/m.14483 type:complete len:218 (-) Transcript_7963:171-824(-)